MTYQVPPEPHDVLAAGSRLLFDRVPGLAALKIHGLSRQGELYLISSAGEQRLVGRGLQESNVLVAQDLTPGEYTLVQSLDGHESTWSLKLSPGSQTFDLKTGVLRL